MKLKWITELESNIENYIAILPKKIEDMKRTSNSMNDPLFRFLEREVTVASKLLSTVNGNLSELNNMCKGVILPNSITKTLAKQIYDQEIPLNWKKYNVMKMPISEWIFDFKTRLE